MSYPGKNPQVPKPPPPPLPQREPERGMAPDMIHERCPKCGFTQFRGPRYVVCSEYLSYECGRCGYVIQRPCLDAGEVPP